MCNGCIMPAGNGYPSGHLVPSPAPILGLVCAPIVDTRFLELNVSFYSTFQLDYPLVLSRFCFLTKERPNSLNFTKNILKEQTGKHGNKACYIVMKIVILQKTVAIRGVLISCLPTSRPQGKVLLVRIIGTRQRNCCRKFCLQHYICKQILYS